MPCDNIIVALNLLEKLRKSDVKLGFPVGEVETELSEKIEKPDWLPSDWTVSIKFRNYGTKDKYYINPSNGLKLSSKAEVLRYLKSCSSELQKSKERNKADLENTSVDDLPPGWIKEIRTVKKCCRTIKEPCYVDPLSGHEFKSLQEVLNYIKFVESDQIKHKSDEEDHNSLKLEDHAQSAYAEVINKKADTTISRCKRVKSVEEVVGSLGSAVTTEVENKDKDYLLTMEHSNQQTFRAERYAYRMRKREIVDGCHVSKSGSAVISQEKVERQKGTNVEQKVRKDDPLTGDFTSKLQKVSGEEHCKAEVRRNNTLTANSSPENNVNGAQSLLSDDSVKGHDAPETSSSEQTREHNFFGDQQEENVAHPAHKTKQTNRKSSVAELPRKASERLACEEIDPFIEIKPTNNRRPMSSTLPSKVHQLSNTDNNGLNGNLDKEIIIPGDFGNLVEPNQQTYMNSISDEQKEFVRSLFEDPCCSDEDLGGVCVEIKDDEKHEQQVEPALENLLNDPCYGFAIKTLMGDIPINDVKEVDDCTMFSLATPNEALASSSPVLPAGNIWDDPSFEFAVNMLTAENSSDF